MYVSTPEAIVEQEKSLLRKKAEQYLSRAEEIKKIIKSQEGMYVGTFGNARIL